METNEKRICPQCGEELEEDALFCTECGASLTKKEEPPKAEPPKAEPLAEEPPTAPPQKEEASAELPKENELVEEAPKEEPAVQEKTSQTAATTVESTPPTVSEEKAAVPKQQDVPAVPIPAAKSERKFCFRCDASIAMEAVFCNKCGAPQGTQPQPQMQSQSQPASPRSQFAAAQMGQAPLPNSMNIDTAALKSWINNGGLSHILLVISVILAGSVFMPFAKGDGSGSLKLMDISVLLSIVILLIAAGSAFASLRGKYEVPVIAGHSLFVAYLCGIFKYQSAMKWGGFLLFPVILGLIVVGLMAALQRDGKALDPNLLGEKWKQIMLQPVQIHTLKLQGIIGVVALAVLMICMPLVGSVGDIVGLDKFEGSWCNIKPNDIPRFIKFKKIADGKYASGTCRIYIAYDSNEHKQYLTTGEPGGIFAGLAIKTHHIYEFANEKKNTIVDTDTAYVPQARDRYYYDSDNKVLLNQTDEQYIPMDEGDEVLKKAYDTLLEYHKNDRSLKGGTPPSFEKYKDAVKKVLDEKVKEEEQYYKRQTR